MEKMNLTGGNNGDYYIRKAERKRFFEEKQPGDTRSQYINRELLERLAKLIASTLPSDTFYMKGSFFLGYLTGRPRFTEDLDMSLIDVTYYEMVKDALQEFGDDLIAEGYVTSYTIADTIEDNRSGGAKFYDAKGHIVLSIDVSKAKAFLSTAVIDINGIGHITVNTVEQVLSDKISVLFSKSRFRRCKDLYDAYVIITTCSINSALLKAAMTARGTLPVDLEQYPFTEERLNGWLPAYDRLKVCDITNTPISDKPSLKEVVKVVSQFLCKEGIC